MEVQGYARTDHSSPGKEEAMKKSVLVSVCTLLLVIAGIAFAAQPPVRNVNPHRHPHLAAAQRHARQAYEATVEAQRANEWDLNGHAQKAKELLDQVNHELKEAAEASNEHGH
jgi:F0F1-type ATP synthase membrane subunit b/b'